MRSQLRGTARLHRCRYRPEPPWAARRVPPAGTEPCLCVCDSVSQSASSSPPVPSSPARQGGLCAASPGDTLCLLLALQPTPERRLLVECEPRTEVRGPRHPGLAVKTQHWLWFLGICRPQRADSSRLGRAQTLARGHTWWAGPRCRRPP